jgi:endoglucanase
MPQGFLPVNNLGFRSGAKAKYVQRHGTVGALHLTAFRSLILWPAMSRQHPLHPVPPRLLYLAFSFVLACCTGRAGVNENSGSGVVHRHGRLQVKNGQLCDQSGNPFQLRGMSSYDLKIFPFGTNTVGHLVNDWHVSVVRASMYTDSYGSSYIREPGVKHAVKLIVDAALRHDIYVIIDWHILQDGNPNRYKEQAKEFFEEMARAYRGHPNVIYEICNEPNGPGATWQEIKAYANFIIPAIRAIDPDGVIIVGTESWSKGLDAAAYAPLDFPNVMYALHFYAGSHRGELRRAADYALSKGLAIIVSEWGLTDYTGKGGLDFDEAEKWVRWMDQHKISWINWSFSPADEGSAALKPKVNIDGPWRASDLSPSGQWIKSKIHTD